MNAHRYANRLSEVLKDIQHRHHKGFGLNGFLIRLGDGHFCDRLQDRSADMNVTINNIKFMVEKVLERHLCEMIFNSLAVTPRMSIIAVRERGNIMLGVSLKIKKREDGTSLFILQLSTYVRDYRIRDTGLRTFEV